MASLQMKLGKGLGARHQRSQALPAAIPAVAARTPQFAAPCAKQPVLSCSGRSTRSVAAAAAAAPARPASGAQYQAPGQQCDQINVVYKFGGSSVRDAERMKEVADIICSFPQYLPAVVLSAMGKTTNMLLECGELALRTPMEGIPDLAPLKNIRKLHLDTCEELGIEASVRQDVEKLLRNLEQLLVGVSIMQDLTPRAKDSLVSYGERLATRIFASYLRTHGVPARQYDAPEMGLITSDDFQNAEIIYEQSLPNIRKSLMRQAGSTSPKEVAIVTGFLGRGMTTGAITTLGRGGSDLTATVLGAALELKEVQVWKDVDGVLTTDPRIVANTRPVSELTFEEATELAYFGAQVLHPAAMQPAIRSGKMNVRVKNSYNRSAPGTIISKQRDMSNVLVTSIVLKNNTTLVDVVSTRMMGQYGFLAHVFGLFERHKISVDVVATSEVSVSLTLDPRKMTDVDNDLVALKSELDRIAQVSYRKGLCILSLICNVDKTSEILQRVFGAFSREGIKVQMMSQGASKTNISLVLAEGGADGQRAVQVLHDEFFGGQTSAN